MAKYNPQLTAPSTTDKNYIHTSAGGYNSCIHVANGSVLPNCVGFAWGRWRSLLGKDPKLSRNNAESWWGTNDGYKRGQTPKLGAVMCWRKGVVGVEADGAGHVAIVEQINADGSVVTSNSAWNGARFYTKTLKPPYSLGGSYVFQGFIYLPVEYDNEPPKEDKPASSGKTYTVKQGDAMYKIAAAHGVTLEALIAANPQIENPDLIHAGEVLNIPAGNAQNAPQELEEGDKVRMTKGAPVYGSSGQFSAWVYDTALYVREVSGSRVVVSTQKTGDITGAVDKKYLTKI